MSRVGAAARWLRKFKPSYDVRFAAIWIVFLCIPIILIATLSEAGLWWDVVAYTATGLFAIVYLIGFLNIPVPGSMAGDYTPRARLPRLAIFTVVLLALTALTIPSLGATVISFFPFLVALGLYTMPIRPGVLWSAGVTLVMFATVALISEGLTLSSFIAPLISIGFVVLMRFVIGWNADQDRTRFELAAVKEREAISRDVHDLLGHTLTVVSLKTQLARRTLRSNPEQAEAELDEVLTHVSTALDEVRATVGRLRTPELKAQLAAAETALDATEIRYAIEGNADAVATEHRPLFAWAVREAVTNIARHSGASSCTISIAANRLTVTDDGTGVRAAEGNGLSGLRRRIEDAEGRLSITSASEDATRPGTKVEVIFP